MIRDVLDRKQKLIRGHTEPSIGTSLDLVPARMLNEYSYCPRLAYLVDCHCCIDG